MNIYLKIDWLHQHKDEPITLYVELSDRLFEIRKIEVFENGDISYADSSSNTGDTYLSTEKYPSLNEIALDPEFRLYYISKDEFENK